MHLTRWIRLGCLLLFATLAARAQETPSVDQLQRQLRELKESFERVQQQQRAQIDALQKQIEALQRPASASAPGTNATSASARELEAELARELGGGSPTNAAAGAPPTTAAAAAAPGWKPSDPIRVGGGKAYADLGLVATFAAGGTTASDVAALQPGGHDPNQRGFTVQGVELSLSGAVDPYFRAAANILYSLDADGESFLEVEEAWMETSALPGNLQVRGGQMFTEFGRLNGQHPHAWAFVDSPLVNARFLGADGLRNPGARISWLAPLQFYSELFLGVQDSHGETAASFRADGALDQAPPGAPPFGYRRAANDRGIAGAGDLLFSPRWANSFDLTEAQTLLAGVSGAFGPNASGGEGDTRSELFGVDVTWKWRSPRHHGGFPFVAVQAEAMLRRYELGAFDWSGVGPDESRVLEADGVTPAALAPETLTDYGTYAQVVWGFRPGWVAGLRGDYVWGDAAEYEQRGLTWAEVGGAAVPLGRDLNRGERWRLSPNLTWYPSEFSKLRLQYNYDDRLDLGVDHSVWLQFEFLLGAHAAHKF